jgi:hypothetical protein
MANPSGESSDYKLTDLDYLIGDHHLQMIKAALPFLEVPEQKAVSVFVKAQELKNTLELFETEEIASMGICSLEEPQSRGSVKELLKAIRPYGTPQEQDLIDLAKALCKQMQAECTFTNHSCAVSCLRNSRPVLKHFK